MTMSGAIGPLILAGSGEYTPAMDMVDSSLIEVIGGKPIILVATSCAQEGDDVMTRWEQMGVEHFKRLGVDAEPLRIRDSEEANVAETYAGYLEYSDGQLAAAEAAIPHDRNFLWILSAESEPRQFPASFDRDAWTIPTSNSWQTGRALFPGYPRRRFGRWPSDLGRWKMSRDTSSRSRSVCIRLHIRRYTTRSASGRRAS